MKELVLVDGKYTIVFDETGSLPIKCLRYGEEWRDLIGDGMVLALTALIEELQDNNSVYETQLDDLRCLNRQRLLREV